MSAAGLSVFILAVITQAGLIGAAIVQRRKTREEREATAVDILQDVTSELRQELVRVAEDRATTVSRLRDEIATLEHAAGEQRADLRQARQDARGAHETTGRAMRRVEHLERILRENGIIFDSGPLA